MERSLRITFKHLREIPPASVFFIAGLFSYPALPTADSFQKYMPALRTPPAAHFFCEKTARIINLKIWFVKFNFKQMRCDYACPSKANDFL